MARVAKYDIQLHAEKQDLDDGRPYGMPLHEEPNWQHLLAQAGIEAG